MIVEMDPSTNVNHGKEPVDEISDTASNVGEPAQGELLLAIQNVMKEITLHRTEMAAQRNADNGGQSEHISRQTKSTSSRKTGATASSVQPETFNKASEMSMTDKLTKFKKFAPPTFKEAKTPAEAEEWLNELV